MLTQLKSTTRGDGRKERVTGTVFRVEVFYAELIFKIDVFDLNIIYYRENHCICDTLCSRLIELNWANFFFQPLHGLRTLL